MTAVSPALSDALFDWIAIVGRTASIASDVITAPVELVLPLPAASVKALS